MLAAQILAANEEIADDLEERNKKADINLKWLYGIGILVVLGVWEWFVIDIIRSQVYATEQNIFQLSDAVLIALLTSATANILTLPAMILRYLFPRNG